MKKVLFTIQWYGLPSSIAASANALCDEYIINELKKDPEFEIHTLSYGVSGYPLKDIIDGVYVHRFKRSLFWDKFIRIRNSKHTIESRIYYWLNRISMRFKQVLFIPIHPNYEPFHTKNFEKEAIRLHTQYGFDLVISEFNGVDSVCAGAAIKKIDPKVVFMPICWDSIAGGRQVKWLPTQLSLYLKRKLEIKIMTLADKAIVMKSSEPFHLKESTTYEYYSKMIYLDVPYLIVRENDDIEKGTKSGFSDKILKLLYSGNMTDRHPAILLDALDKLDVIVDFTFISLPLYHNNILKLSSNYSNVRIHCLPYMSHDELKKYQVESDILVNFGVSNANAVSGKIFDYMSLGKPIISTIFIDNEACIPYLQIYPKALIFDERKSTVENVDVLRNFISCVNTIPINMGDIRKVFYCNTPTAYIEIIKSLLKY